MLLGSGAVPDTCCRTLGVGGVTVFDEAVLVLDALHQVVAPPPEVLLLVEDIQLLTDSQ